MLVLPPLVWLIALGGVFVSRKRAADPGAAIARGALRRLRGRLGALSRDDSDETFYGGVMDSFRIYLGEKLGVAGRSLTVGEIETLLVERGVDGELVGEVKDLLSKCEYGAYAGGSVVEGRGEIPERAMETARRLDKVL